MAGVISGSGVRERGFTLPRLLPRRLRSLHTLVLVLAAVLIGWLGWLWYSGSSFVKIEHVTVTGLSGPDVPQIRDALTAAALQMTTLNVNTARLDAAVSRYAYVRGLTVAGEGAHRVVIHVAEQVPVATVRIGTTTQVVDADGRLLPAATRHGLLPTVPLAATPASTSITAPGARAAIAVLAAAPYALLAHIGSATSSSAHGVIVQLRNGPQLYFGATAQLAQKWTAAVAVLQNSDSAGAAYIDLTDPQRPAPGTGVSAKQATALGLASGAAAAGGRAG
ncbi:MAG: cell division protein FtsQ/DivIB [Acidobacteriota bacterium]|nr:cell division protein FtsQ/DivIB [Acidobacteriota bacterium]